MKKSEPFFIASLAIILLLGSSYFIVPLFTKDVYSTGQDTTIKNATSTQDEQAAVVPPKPVVAHVKTPEEVKAIYMSSCAATTQSFRTRLINMIETTELNAIMIDIKDYTGTLSFIPQSSELQASVTKGRLVRDMKEFIQLLHDKNIYVIGRITVFQDPFYSKLHPELAVKRASDGGMWKDRKGLSYLDPGHSVVWDYAVNIGKESYDIGFDELNYDYIRFPSDGNMQDIAFPSEKSMTMRKSDVIEEFFKYLHDSFRNSPEYKDVVLSGDLFGMVTTNTDDLNIGQVLEKGLPYFDYIAPMVYPSHFPKGFNGYSDPNKRVYDVIKFTMDAAVRRTIATSTVIKTIGSEPIASTTPQRYTKQSYDKNKIRPWLQDFDYGGNYGPTEVRAQIQATYDAGLNSWMLWDAGNKYTPDALFPEGYAGVKATTTSSTD